MTLTIGNWFAHLLLLALLALPGGGSPLQQQAAQLVMTVPAACPPGGCAAGQRLGIQAGFALQPPSSPEAVERNVQLCFYTPASWGAQGFDPAGFGEVTSAPYEARTDACGEPPENFSLLGGLATRLNSDLWLNDSVQFAFRIGPAAAANGSLIMTVLEDSSGSWTRTGQAALTIPVVPLAPTVYVAASESACGIYSPCYINSAGDKEGGIGTGLKDAIDSQTGPVDIVILGNYRQGQHRAGEPAAHHPRHRRRSHHLFRQQLRQPAAGGHRRGGHSRSDHQRRLLHDGKPRPDRGQQPG